MTSQHQARVAAARARVALDRKIGRDTPQWVADLATDPDLAGRYFDDELAPGHRATGVPDEALASLRKRYIADVRTNDEAQRQVEEHYAPRRWRAKDGWRLEEPSAESPISADEPDGTDRQWLDDVAKRRVRDQ